jgi:hypothetical protein
MNPFQKILLTRPPERNSEGTRFDVWMRTDDGGVRFLGTGEVVNSLPAPVGSRVHSSEEGNATAAPRAGGEDDDSTVDVRRSMLAWLGEDYR